MRGLPENRADVAINYNKQDFVEAARAATGGAGPEVILDMVGGDYIRRNLDAVAVDGRISQIAFQQGARVDIDHHAHDQALDDGRLDHASAAGAHEGAGRRSA